MVTVLFCYTLLLLLLQYVLAHPQCWSVQSAALFRRSVVQRNKRRTVERSMMQLQVCLCVCVCVCVSTHALFVQELVDCYSKAAPDVCLQYMCIMCVCVCVCVCVCAVTLAHVLYIGSSSSTTVAQCVFTTIMGGRGMCDRGTLCDTALDSLHKHTHTHTMCSVSWPLH